MEYSGWVEQAETVFIHLIVGCDEIDVLVRNFQSSVVQSIKKKRHLANICSLVKPQ